VTGKIGWIDVYRFLKFLYRDIFVSGISQNESKSDMNTWRTAIC